MFQRRLAFVLALSGIYFLALFLRLFQLQVVQASRWREEARALGRREVRLPARRGALLDRDGVVLAEDRLELDLVVRWSEFDGHPWRCEACGRPTATRLDRPPRRCPGCGGTAFAAADERDLSRLPGLLGVPPDELERRLEAARREWRRKAEREYLRRERLGDEVRRADVDRELARWSYEVSPDVPEAIVGEVTLRPERYRGLEIDPTFRRARPAGDAVGLLVGRVSGVFEEEAKELRKRGHGWGEIFRMRVGRSGLERLFEPRLAAEEGRRVVDRDATGRVREVLEEVPARDGEPVRTSLSVRLTEAVTATLGEAAKRHDAEGGGFVAMDPETGEVLVLATWPPDPEDGVHRALAAVVPGSVHKVVTALAGLLSGELDPDEPFECVGLWHGIGCHGAKHGRIGLVEAIAESCNGYFASAAERMGNPILAHWARELGFGEVTGLGLLGEDAGLVPDEAWKAERHRQDPERFPYPVLHPGEVRQIGFGQGYVMVTPLQVARLMAVLANGGREVTPTLLLGGAPPGKRIVEEGSLAIVRKGLEEVVRSGTGGTTGLARFRAAGKTGTAEVGTEGRNMAWFAGYAPADGPRVAFACYLSRAKVSGAVAAGPVVERFLEELEAR